MTHKSETSQPCCPGQEVFVGSWKTGKAGMGCTVTISRRRLCSSSAWVCAHQIPSGKKFQAVPVQARSGGAEGTGEGDAVSNHLLCSCGIALTLQWFFHLLSTSLIVIPVNPLRDPWNCSALEPKACCFLLLCVPICWRLTAPLSTRQLRSLVVLCRGHHP